MVRQQYGWALTIDTTCPSKYFGGSATGCLVCRFAVAAVCKPSKDLHRKRKHSDKPSKDLYRKRKHSDQAHFVLTMMPANLDEDYNDEDYIDEDYIDEDAVAATLLHLDKKPVRSP